MYINRKRCSEKPTALRAMVRATPGSQVAVLEAGGGGRAGQLALALLPASAHATHRRGVAEGLGRQSLGQSKGQRARAGAPRQPKKHTPPAAECAKGQERGICPNVTTEALATRSHSTLVCVCLFFLCLLFVCMYAWLGLAWLDVNRFIRRLHSVELARLAYVTDLSAG